MTVQEFTEKIRDEILADVQERFEGADLTTFEVDRGNGIRRVGLLASGMDRPAIPILYMEEFLNRYEAGEPLEELVTRIRDIYLDVLENSADVEAPILDKEHIRDSLRLDLVDLQKDESVLDTYVGVPVGCGYALTAYIQVQAGTEREGRVRITREMASYAEYSEEQLLKDALERCQKEAPPTMERVTGFGTFFLGTVQDLLDAGKTLQNEELLKISTPDEYYGASALFYPGVQEKLGELLGRDYFVIPCSCHELLVMPADLGHDAVEIVETVRKSNIDIVPPEEQLGNRVMKYRTRTGKLQVEIDLDRDLGMEREL
ncbi:MAG: hypothetical protein IJ091_06480 [Oscillospiraceae bacterium]|nr:hypothetical protein [Oscillospiraceae bacterium]